MGDYTNTGEICTFEGDVLGLDRMGCTSNEVKRHDIDHIANVLPRCYPKSGECFDGQTYLLGVCYGECQAGYKPLGAICMLCDSPLCLLETPPDLEYLQTKKEEARDQVLSLEATEPTPLNNLEYLKAKEKEAHFRALLFQASGYPDYPSLEYLKAKEEEAHFKVLVVVASETIGADVELAYLKSKERDAKVLVVEALKNEAVNLMVHV